MTTTTGSYCWACGANVHAIIINALGKRCLACYAANAPLDPKHVGKLTDMDRLPMATKHDKPRR
jgi:hypothetical protein